MSIQNRRKAFLGFGVLAAVLIVAVIAIWPPPFFDQDAATGAIGAVEKHREQQIAPQDVVLGDEATRREQQVVFGHYLNDAAKLQSISAEMASRATARARAANAELQLESLSAEMQVRFAQNVDYAVAAMEQLLARDVNLQSRLASEIADIGAKARNPQLASAEMQSLSTRLAAVAEQLQARECCGSRDSIEAQTLASVEQLMGRAVAPLQARSWSTAALGRAAEEIDNGSRALGVRPLGVDYAGYIDYLSNLSLQAKKLADTEQQLAAIEQLQSEEQVAARLNVLSETLASEAFALESRALQNAEAQVAVRSAMAARLHSIEEIAAAANRAAATRASQVASQDMQAFSRAMQNFSAALASRQHEFQARAAANTESQLAMFDAHLAARKQVAARGLDAGSAVAARLADIQALESRRADLMARTQNSN